MSTAPMTPAQNAQAALTVAASVAPLLGPGATVAVTIASSLLNAVMGAMATGSDVTDAQLDGLLDADNAAKMRNQLVRASMGG